MFGSRARIGFFLGLAVLALALSELWLGIRSVSPGPGSVVGPRQQTVEARVTGLPLAAELRVDGRPVPTQVRWGQVQAQTGLLAEGDHTLELRLRGSVRTLAHTWSVRSDSTPPPLSVALPEVVPRTEATVKGRTEPAAEVRLNGTLSFRADAAGEFAAPVRLRGGWNRIAVTARDPAGNEQRSERRVFCDLEAPELCIQQPKDAAVVKTPAPEVRLEARDAGGLAGIRFRVDEGKWRPAPEKLCLTGLAEGLHRLEIEVQDRAGWATLRGVTFTLDSSEKFGERELGLGATGKDVRELQRRLARVASLPSGALSGHLDEATLQAVGRFQEHQLLFVSGRVDRATLVALGPRVTINLSRFSLVLDVPGAPLQRYPIAHGVPEYPTPTGRFAVAEKVLDPTWLPPDSPWAAGAEPVPPGPGNPLGTRWIGLSGGVVGIHGTSSPWSIGSRASHGCVRMYVSDAEQLYKRVEIGTPVTILSGYESSEEALKYWK